MKVRHISSIRPWAIAWTVLTLISVLSIATYDLWTADEGFTGNLWATWLIWGILPTIMLWILTWERGD